MTALSRSWGRRNAWALVALVPVAAAALWATSGDYVRLYRNGTPRVAVSADASGEVSYDRARFEVDRLTPDVSPLAATDPDFELPSGARAWELRLAVEPDVGADTDALITCHVTLFDASGRSYSPDPGELGGGDYGYSSVGCDPSSAVHGRTPATPTPGSAYQVRMLFVLPGDATVASVHVVDLRLLPRYAVLPVPSG